MKVEDKLSQEANISKPTPRVSRLAALSGTFVVMGATLLSRVLGLARDIVITHQFRAGDQLSAYYAAFRIPDALYLLIIGGALGSALIPVFSRFLGQNQPEQAWRLANAIVNFSLVALLLAATFTFISAPLLVDWLIAPGYKPELRDLTINLTRLLLIQPIFLGLGGIAMALLNGTQHFTLPALAPVIYNVCLILGALFLAEPLGIYGLVAGVLVGAVLYLAIQIPVLIRLGLHYRPGLDRSAPGLGEVLKVLGPRLLGQAAFQANFIAMTNLASSNSENVTFLTLAYGLLMLPFGIFALSTATVAFPAMAKQFGAGDMEGFKKTFSNGVRQISFFCLPAAVGLVLLRRPIVRTLYEGGLFGPHQVDGVSEPLLFFGLALLSYGLAEIATRAFYAMHDTRTPVTITIATIVLNVILGKILVGAWGASGLALGLSVTTTIEMALLLIYLRPKMGKLLEAEAPLTLLKMLGAAGTMAVVLGLSTFILDNVLVQAGKLAIIGLTLILIALGGIIYAVAAYLLRIEELRGTLNRITNRLSRK
jgi:putative peptidoglycan lipid II flippase